MSAAENKIEAHFQRAAALILGNVGQEFEFVLMQTSNNADMPIGTDVPLSNTPFTGIVPVNDQGKILSEQVNLFDGCLAGASSLVWHNSLVELIGRLKDKGISVSHEHGKIIKTVHKTMQFGTLLTLRAG